MTARRRARRWALWTIPTVAVAALLTVAAVGVGGKPPPPRAAPIRWQVVDVERGTLSVASTVDGTVGFAPDRPLATAGTGTVTWLPRAGSVIRRGEPLLRINEAPIMLLYGSVPSYRAIGPGVPAGSDIKQLQANLTALGYCTCRASGTFTPTTATGITSWQRHTGQQPTGQLALGSAIFQPGPIRISQVTGFTGDAPAPGLLRFSGLTRYVTATTAVSDVEWAPGTTVRVIVRGHALPGKVVSADVGQSDTRTITVAVTGAAEQLGQPGNTVSLEHVTAQAKNILSVPVTALVALAEGGFGLQLDERTARYVAVRTGLFAQGRVEVSGSGVAAGLHVRVPD